MAKKKSKQNKQSKQAKKALSKQTNDTTVMGLSSANVRQVGAAIAGAVVVEVVELLAQRLTQKSNRPNSVDKKDQDSTEAFHPVEAATSGLQTVTENVGSVVATPVNAAKATVQEVVEDIKPAITDSVMDVKAAADTTVPVFAGVVDSLKTAAQKAIEQSSDDIGTRASTVAESAIDTAMNLVGTTGLFSQEKPDKHRKKKLKKHKKRNE